jgi:pimeloyl-ACP methyl ester carboxylesterase
MTERVVRVNGVDLCVEAFGEPGEPTVLLVGASLLTWDEDFCRRLAAGRRRVVRYDVRDTGRSTTDPAGEPSYTLRDLVLDAVGLLDELGVDRAHVVGFSSGGWIAQLLALDHADRVASLALIATRPTSPGPADADLPEHDEAYMSWMTDAGEPDWTDRDEVVAHLVEDERRLAGPVGFDGEATRRRSEDIVDRARNIAAHDNIAFADHGDRWRERLGEIDTPTLVVHGTADPFFPYGNGVALAREIPGAELLTLDGVGHALPRAVWDEVVPALLHLSAAER